jgi:hypothetical protein
LDPKHELISEIKRIAVELKRRPTQREFNLYKQTKYSFEGHFGNYSVFLIAAGMQDDGKREPKSKIKYDDIFEVHGEYLEKKSKIEIAFPKIRLLESDFLGIVEGDSHDPWYSVEVRSVLYHLVEKYKPTWVAQAGDCMDMYSQSKFSRSLFTFNPKEEFELAKQSLAEKWATIQKLSPNTKCVQILGNHDMRPYKRMLEKNPESEIFFMDGFRKAFEFPGVTTYMDPRELVEISPGVWITHGHLKHGEHCKKYRRTIIHGHDHKANETHYPEFYEASAGFAGDWRAKCFEYTPARFKDSITGLRLVDAAGTRFLRIETP